MKPDTELAGSIRLIQCQFFVILSLLGCQMSPPPKQPLDELIQTLKSKDWAKAKDFFDESNPLDTFPLYKALKNGSTWIDLVQVRSVDHHLIFEVDLSSPPPHDARIRYRFWGRAAQFQNMTKSNVNRTGMISGWSDPHTLSPHDFDVHHLSLPRRFAAPAYRTIRAHRDHTYARSQSLGVIGTEGSGALESGWNGLFEFQSTHLQSLNKQRKRSCRKVKRAWSKYLSVLQTTLRTQCMKPLLFAAQRHRYIDVSLLANRIDVSRGRGGQEIRSKQDEEVLKKFLDAEHTQVNVDTTSQTKVSMTKLMSNNGVAFSGRVTLQQSLEFTPQQRVKPDIIEAIIVAPPLTQCIQKSVDSWSRDFLKQDTCQYTISVLFSVSESDL